MKVAHFITKSVDFHRMHFGASLGKKTIHVSISNFRVGYALQIYLFKLKTYINRHRCVCRPTHVNCMREAFGVLKTNDS